MTSEMNDFIDAGKVEALLGSALKDAYVELIDIGDDADDSPFTELTVDVIESVSRESAVTVEGMYFNGTPPLFDDSRRIAAQFVQKFVQRFRDALCAELSENKDLSAFGKGMVVTLVPTTMVLLGLKPAHVALAVPISIITARIAVRGLCDKHAARIRDKKFLEERIELHRRSLIQLEGATALITDKVNRAIFLESIQWEEQKIRSLEKELDSYNSPQSGHA